MSNSILTPTMITREALRVLHGKLSFIGNVNRQYDSQFAQSGARIGSTLNIRLPSRYTVRTGATLTAQDHVERSTPLTITSQVGVDVSFTTVDLTMSLDDFSKRIITPAMAQLSAYLENQAITTAYKSVAQYVGTTSTSLSYLTFQQAGGALTDQLAPYGNRTAALRTLDRINFSNDVKGLFQDSEAIREQYKEGIVGRTGGMDVYENTYIPSHTRGSFAGSPLTTGATIGVSTTANSWTSQTSLTIDTATSATTLKAGDILTVSGVYDVHPETKVNTGNLKKFVVQADVTLTTLANTYTATVVPAMIYGVGNAYQNCVLSGVSDTDNNTVTAFGVASTAYGQSLAFHEDAFCFGTADLIDVSEYGAWGARQSMDGISMRIAKQYTIASDQLPCRIDILWGFGAMRPENACRIMTSLT